MGPTFVGAPPARIVLVTQPLDVDPNGFARWLVRANFVDARGLPTQLLHGGNVDFVPSRGSAQWQTRLRFGGPAAIVSTTADGPLSVRVVADVGVPVPDATASTDTRRWTVQRIVARALGPHAVYVGWFPATDGRTEIRRYGGGPSIMLSPRASTASHSVDATVAPGQTYSYAVRLPRGPLAIRRVAVPAEPRHADRSALGGKKMWLSFSTSTADADGYDRLVPADIVARAKAGGLRALLLRTGYGPLSEITPADKSVIDAIIDLSAASGIATIAWTVPRSTSFEDLAASVAATQYVTARGNGFAAIAVDLERGGFFLGSGTAGYAELAEYPRALRAALGPSFPIVATVEDPYLEHLTRASYPYDAIAANVDVLEPMAYWQLLAPGIAKPQGVRAALRGSYAATLREAGRSIPIDIGLLTSGGAPRRIVAATEIAAGIDESRKLGAVGVTFFDWGGARPADWDALASTPW
jgi:hypothetical protein